MPGIGAYGKMPALGDFFRIGLGDGFVTPWDRWLQGVMADAQARLGERWEAAYMSAPIWRFSLPGGALGPSPVAGVMMPSVDRVGRKFPLVLAGEVAEAAPGGSLIAAHFARAPAFEALEEVALATLDEGMGRDALAERLAAEAFPEGQGAEVRSAGGGLAVRAGTVEALAPALLAELRAGKAEGVWSAHLDGDHRLFLADGPPEGALGLALFDLGAAVWGAPAVSLPDAGEGDPTGAGAAPDAGPGAP